MSVDTRLPETGAGGVVGAAVGKPPPRRRRRSLLRTWVPPLVTLMLFLGVWYYVSYVGLDAAPHVHVDLVGPLEAIPADSASFDVALCIQVLEHVDDPAQGVRELGRVTRPGGRVLLSTHGTFVYHPNPVDLWRWTGAGLGRLFSENGEWASVTVSAGSGTASSLAMLNAIYLEHVLRRTPLRPLRGTRPGTLAGNYHVVAERAE